MIQFNLLPDVKQDYIKSQRFKRTTMTITLLAAAAALGIMILLVAVTVLQKQHLKGLSKDIDNYSSELKSIADLDKVLTVQNQLNSLPELHNKKPVTSRMFTYLSQIVPDKISISKLDLDFKEDTITFTGSADSLVTVNKFVDTLKFTTYTVDGNGDENAFTEVVMTSFSKSDKGANYNIEAKFNSDIFDSSKNVKLVVPKIVTTRSETGRPGNNLFQEQSQPTNETQVSQ